LEPLPDPPPGPPAVSPGLLPLGFAGFVGLPGFPGFAGLGCALLGGWVPGELPLPAPGAPGLVLPPGAVGPLGFCGLVPGPFGFAGA